MHRWHCQHWHCQMLDPLADELVEVEEAAIEDALDIQAIKVISAQEPQEPRELQMLRELRELQPLPKADPQAPPLPESVVTPTMALPVASPS